MSRPRDIRASAPALIAPDRATGPGLPLPTLRRRGDTHASGANDLRVRRAAARLRSASDRSNLRTQRTAVVRQA
jgi:hypothetical protein